MSIRTKIASLISGNSQTDLPPINDRFYDLFREITGSSDHFDNMYPDIVKAARSFAKIEPFFEGKNGKPRNSPLLDAFYAPNTKMSAHQFRMMLAVSTMVHNRYYILVHDKKDVLDQKISRNISDVRGYDIILPKSITIFNGNISIKQNGVFISVDPSRIFAMDDVLDPQDLRYGYSPYNAAKNIANLDDLITAARTKMFKRGGIPEGIMSVLASADGYETVTKKISEEMRAGSGNRGIIFSHKPVKNGEVGDDTIKWTPLSASPRDMTNDAMEKSVAKKISGFIGVPDEVKGYLQNSNYASVAMALRIMQTQVVDDLATSIYSKFTAGLQNIFGDIGGEFSFEAENPFFADEAEKIATTDTTNLENIATLQAQGYTVEGAVVILGLPARFLAMADPKYKFTPDLTKTSPDENISVQNGDDTPEAVASRKTAANNDQKQPEFRFAEVNLAKYEKMIDAAAKNQMKKDADNAISGLSEKSAAPNDKTDENDQEFQDILTVFLLATIFASINTKNSADLVKLKSLGVDTDKISQYTAGDQRLARSVREFSASGSAADAEKVMANFAKSSSPIMKDLKTHLSRVAKDFNAQTSEKIREIVASGVNSGMTTTEISQKLATLVDEARAKRLAVSEVHRSQGLAKVDYMKYLTKVSNVESVYKSIYSTTGSPCEFCEALIGTWVPISDALIPLGEKITGTSGGEQTYDYESIQCANLHPHDHCEDIFRIFLKGGK